MSDKPRIACCAIVKNEEEILERMIKSVEFMVSKFVIFDTGSTDSTKEIIAKYGEVYETPFVNFVNTKNKVLESVDKMEDVDYILWMDADEILEVMPERLLEIIKNTPDCDFFDTDIVDAHDDIPTIAYTRKRVWKNHHYDEGWKFRGPGIHEYMHITSTLGFLDRTVKVYHKHKKQGKNYTQNYEFYLKTLLNAVSEDPSDLRGWFYLARTYKDLGEYDNAIKTYRHYIRSAKEQNYTWKDEIFQAIFDIAVCYELMDKVDEAIEEYENASRYDERRAEGLFSIARISFYNNKYKDLKKCKEYLINILKKHQ